MARLLVFVAALAFTCDAFVVRSPVTSPTLRSAVAATPALSSPVMLFGSPTKAPKKAKKAVKKVVKKKVAKKVAKKPVKGPAAALPGSDVGELVGKFFSAENWAVQAVTSLGGGEVPVAALAGIGLWGLIVLR